jgi:DNA-binding SARP family transcriptional activator
VETVMRFGVLGPVVVQRGREAVGPDPGRQSAVLALLLADANLTVPLDRLAEDLWAGTPPSRPFETLRVYVSNLRRLLHRTYATRGRG